MVDPNTAMETAKEGAVALTKFQEIVQKIFGPRWTRKQADADAYADQQKLATIRDNPDMEIMFVDGKMHARQRTPEELLQQAQYRMLEENIRQERNLENIVGIASCELLHHDSQNVSNRPVNEDWITRLFSIAKDINSEEMQYVWGKILAGEIVAPNSFSFRTLDTLRNISEDEARLFQKILPLVVKGGDDYFLTSNGDILQKYDISYSDILTLDECGLVNAIGTMVMENVVPENAKITYRTDEHGIIIENKSAIEKRISFGIYSLTRVGIELFQILSYTPNTNYLLDFADKIRNENENVDVIMSVNKIKGIDGRKIAYEPNPIATF